MDAKARQIVEEMQRDGRQTFAQWDPQLFDDISEGPAKDLWVALLGNARTPQAAQYDTLADYLRLVSEAIGNGYLVESANGMDLNNVMASCLRDWIPSRLASVSPGKRAESLSTAWNLCEGVLRQPAWINAYLMTRADEMTDLATLEEFFARLLDPVFSPTADAQWTGSLDFTVIDPSEFDEHFLPGEITPLANRVVSVADRRSRSRLGVLLQKSRQSRCLGH
ncbi:MAG: hypothetical protein QF805_29185, partial [Pirellulaceae bacterium]|nr:hypothetical protein [Pirellulaceae bacterium]